VPEDERSPAADHLRVLAHGEVEVIGRMPWSSNGTFLAACCDDGTELHAVYKPGRGERQLWDFPTPLYRREVAAYELSELLGWGLVPETVERRDGPFGEGSLQRFVDADFSEHHFTLVDDSSHHDQLRAICAFDIVANNADRKSGHCLLGEDGNIWAIDNSLCFHREPKLRTVIWEFAGEPLPDRLRAGLEKMCEESERLEGLRQWLSAQEVGALRGRARSLADSGCFPGPSEDRYHYPWPLV
jgi:uncharacterized repeat protein (TIGR03843 family)